MYLAERDLLGPLDRWLATAFALHRLANGIAFDRHDRLYVAETVGGNMYRYDTL